MGFSENINVEETGYLKKRNENLRVANKMANELLWDMRALWREIRQEKRLLKKQTINYEKND